jgi:hypothetical protein
MTTKGNTMARQVQKLAVLPHFSLSCLTPNTGHTKTLRWSLSWWTKHMDALAVVFQGNSWQIWHNLSHGAIYLTNLVAWRHIQPEIHIHRFTCPRKTERLSTEQDRRGDMHVGQAHIKSNIWPYQVYLCVNWQHHDVDTKGTKPRNTKLPKPNKLRLDQCWAGEMHKVLPR